MSKIVNYIIGIKNHFSKGDAELDLQYSLTSLDTSIKTLEVLQRAIVGSKLSHKLNTAYATSFYRSLRVTSINSSISIDGAFLVDLTHFLRNARDNGEVINSELRHMRGNTVLSDALSYKEANVVRSVQLYFFMSNYVSDLLNIIIANETASISETKNTIAPAVIKRIADAKNVNAFTAVIAAFGVKPDVFKKQINNLSTNIVSQDANDRIDSFNDDVKDIVPGLHSEFASNPIYMVRSAIATWQVARYQKLQEEERMLSIRLANFEKIRSEGTTDPALDSKIEDYQSRLDNVNRKIAKMEESVK